jgi:hypothetical protein
LGKIDDCKAKVSHVSTIKKSAVIADLEIVDVAVLEAGAAQTGIYGELADLLQTGDINDPNRTRFAGAPIKSLTVGREIRGTGIRALFLAGTGRFKLAEERVGAGPFGDQLADTVAGNEEGFAVAGLRQAIRPVRQRPVATFRSEITAVGKDR